MSNSIKPPFHNKGPNKDKDFQSQMKVVFQAFHISPKTMLMVSVETGILRANICRFIAKWRKKECITELRKGICPISKENGVKFFTTNPEFIPASKPQNNQQ